jgi:hypothetical protein
MIIEKPFETGDVISVKLTSGEEMVCRLDKKGQGSITVKKPMMLVAGPDGGMGLAPFMFTVDPNGQFKIQLENIICTVRTAKDAADMYLQATTGIVTA